ncbi:MAG: hypothetical protein QM813_28150 [Verrucomicrobiota bacterium]
MVKNAETNNMGGSTLNAKKNKESVRNKDDPAGCERARSPKTNFTATVQKPMKLTTTSLADSKPFLMNGTLSAKDYEETLQDDAQPIVDRSPHAS